jgi:outer membrane murein-binding lipoprotein Lpp
LATLTVACQVSEAKLEMSSPQELNVSEDQEEKLSQLLDAAEETVEAAEDTSQTTSYQEHCPDWSVPASGLSLT